MSAWDFMRNLMSQPPCEPEPASAPPAHPLLGQVLTATPKPPLERVEELTSALELAQQIAQAVRERLDAEYGRLQTAIAQITPEARVAGEVYDGAVNGLAGYYQAFQLLEEALESSDASLLAEARGAAWEADRTLVAADEEAGRIGFQS